MLADLLVKSLQGALFVKFCEVIMVWKHVYTLHMGPPSTKECVIYTVEVESIKGEVEYSAETKEENTERNKLYSDIVIHWQSLYWG